ncbi:MAG: hypothetical protein V5804_15145 [Mucilaginibacter sp.]
MQNLFCPNCPLERYNNGATGPRGAYQYFSSQLRSS